MEDKETALNKEEITLKDYILTNLHRNGHFAIKLKDGKEYECYRSGKEHYIKKDNKEIFLNKDVNRLLMLDIKKYNKSGI